MTEKELNNALRGMAVSKGLCQQWQQEWENGWNEDKMILQFYRGIDFFLKNRFVSNDFIKQNFHQDFLRRHGIIVDDKYSLLNPGRSIVMGSGEATIRTNGYWLSAVYAVDNANLKIETKNASYAIVSVLGDAVVEATQLDHSRLTVIMHSRNAKLTTTGNVRVREDYNYLKKKL